MDPPTRDVEEMDFEQLSDFFEAENIPYDHLITLEEMQELYIKSSASRSSTNETESPSANQDGMKVIMVKDKQMRLELADIYGMLIEYVNDAGDGAECILSIMKEIHGNFDKTIAEHKDELINDECPIIVTGETSAGKSSLLNLILDTDVLAESLLGTTTTICRLHNSKSKRIEIQLDSGKTKVIESSGDDIEWKDALKPYITSRDTENKPKYKQVDVYWPIPVLQDHITIVDTPGIGENDTLTEVLLSYLPKAVAFIYVVNSANSGGIQDDHLLRILNHQQRMMTIGDQPVPVDYNSSIFVCNKWDKVLQEEERVWNHIKETINTHLHDFPEDQIFKMSVTEADRHKKSGLGMTPKYEQLSKAIEKLVGQSMQGKIRKHYTWIESFVLNLQSKLLSRINNAKNKEDHKAKLKEEVLKRLTKLNMDAEGVKSGLISARTECERLAEQLYKHMQRDDIREQILTWDNDEISDIEADYLEVTKYRAEQRIMARIRAILKHWEEETGIVETVSERLKKLFINECQLLGKGCMDINLLIEGQSGEWPDSLDNPDEKSENESEILFTKSEKLALVVTAPVWVPLVTVASLMFLPVGIGMFVNDTIKEKKQRSQFMKNKPSYMRDWAKKTIDICFTEENIHAFVSTVYFGVFEHKIEQLCSDYIPKQIAAYRRMINDIVADIRSTSQILGEFQPLLHRLRMIIGKLRLYDLDHLNHEKIPFESLGKRIRIGEGNFSSVYKATWTDKNEKSMDVALKVFKKKISGANLLGQLEEVDCLRKLRHKNIVELYGVCYSSNDDNGDKVLNIVLELCECSLEYALFNDRTKQCANCQGTERKGAMAFYLSMATGVCEGIAEMHRQKYHHRDLKLSNVLVKNGTAKLCDLGFSKNEALMTGTFAGSFNHMSPELLKGERYSFSSDIYSLGIMLWELWYGRHAYTENEYADCPPFDLIAAIKTGKRPKLTYNFRPTDKLKALITDCWDSDPSKRPQAKDVSSYLQGHE
ncbi:hypothetical protein ACF0H5_004718 [Mactra antiquata]